MSGTRVYIDDANENNPAAVLQVGMYHPYWNDRVMRVRNPQFDEWSARILALKRNDDDAVEFFFHQIAERLAHEIAIAVVPGHEPIVPGQLPSGLVRLARRLASGGRIDASGCLVRTHVIPKLSLGGSRSVAQHRRTIAPVNVDLIQNRAVLLLDDVTTTENSLTACKDILLDNGATKVKCLALGRTQRDASRA